MSASLQVLLVEDDPMDTVLFESCWARATHPPDIHHVARVSSAVEWLSEHEPDIVVLDLGLPDGRGLSVVQRVSRARPGVPIIILTGQDDEEMAIEALSLGAQEYILKQRLASLELPQTVRFAIERHQLNQRLVERAEALSRISVTDSLTELLNRRGLESFIREERRSLEQGDAHMALLVDVDNFKRFNDEHGHHVGDQVLCAIASSLRGSVRSSDVVSRVGGDEFLAILPHTDPEEGMQVAERLLDDIASLRVYADGQALHVTASIGLASFHELGLSVDCLLELTHGGLALSKRSGKNRACAIKRH